MIIAASQCDKAEVHACLDRMLASPLFAHAERQKRLLRYLVGATLAGKTELLKGYTVAVEVFDRAPDFDPAVDAIVRVQAGQLRAKLREYYENRGREDPFRFELPKGGYAVHIEAREAPPSLPLKKGGGGGILKKGGGEDTVQAGSSGGISAQAGGAARRGDFARPALIQDKPSLAVLPFVNWSSDPEQEYFADGITEDLTTELSRLSGLFIISRHSAFVYKGMATRAEKIGAELGVRYLLEGSVRRCDRNVRISAQLIDATSRTHVWAERYDRELADIFAVQDDVTRRIVDMLQVKLTRGETEDFGIEGTLSVEAYEMLLRGRERFFLMTPESNREAKAFYKKALEIDPSYAAAHAWLARSYGLDWAMDWERDANMLEAALEHVLRAVYLDDRLALAHAVLGWVQLWRKQGDAAIAAGRQAVALDPNNADARLFLAMSLVATAYGEEALIQIRIAMRLNPHPTTVYLMALGICYYVLGDYDRAIVACERGTELNPAFTPNWSLLTAMYTLTGRRDDAGRTREKVVQLTPIGRPSSPVIFFTDEALVRRYEHDWKLAWGE